MKRPWPRRAAATGCLALLGLALAGCGRPVTRVDLGNRHQILHLGNGTEPRELDPQLATGVPEQHITPALFEGLATEDPQDLHAVPGVAERWDVSADGTVFTFHLRPDAKWSNGEPVTARDFVAAYRRILTPSLAAEYAQMHYVVKNAEDFHRGRLTDFSAVGYRALDDATLQITLHHPTPYFLSLVTRTPWLPVHLPSIERHGSAYERGNAWAEPGRCVGNGPFALAQWRLNDVLIVTNNPHYWDAARVRLKEIRFYPIDSLDAEERAFRGGQLHATESVPAQRISSYQQSRSEWLQISPYLGVYFYRCNVTQPPLNDPRVRRALSLAIDREAIVAAVTRGGQLPAYTLTPPGIAGYTAPTPGAADLAEARRLLSAAGFSEGKNFPPLEILFNTLESHRAIAEAIQQMWKKNLGIDVRLLNQDWKVFVDAQSKLDYQIARAGYIGDYVDPDSFLQLFLSGGPNNRTGWANKDFDRLLGEAARTTTPAGRFPLLAQAEALLLEEAPVLPIHFYTRVRLVRPELKGWSPNLLDDHPYKYLYLETARN